MPEILFICTANQIRSPLAQELFKQLLKEHEQEEGWRVKSAGTWAIKSAPPLRYAVSVGQEMGVDISAHRSKPVNAEMMESADLVLVMEHGHKEALRFEFPLMREKIYLLTEMAGKTAEIEDPIGGSLEEFRSKAYHLREILTNSYEKIISYASKSS